MPDREKVIKGLEHCGFNEKRGCVGCPYSDECGDFGRDAGMSSLATDALALLREQEPAEPKKGFWLHPTSLDCCCSVCEMQPEHEPGSEVPLYPYCPYCGAKMEEKYDT